MEPKLDLFFPDTHNLKTLAIVDVSQYPSNWNIKNPTIEITPPSFTKKHIPFSVQSLNIYNSNSVGLTCGTCDYVNLPDGIWYVKFSVAPAVDNYIERSFLRIDNLKVRMESVFMCVDMEECDADVKWEKLQIIDQIEVYIEGAIAAANQCNNPLAMKLYEIASKMITNLLKKC